jgi:hypothetical protein
MSKNDNEKCQLDGNAAERYRMNIAIAPMYNTPYFIVKY